ncbi:MAG: hypothetical protein KAU58_03300, partial [Candidatus Omnitrophica bacterium]|nr:hypothetical protein [Candidatus Omnitrophota bacterium]
FVSIPITEVHSSILSGAGTFAAGGAIQATMDTSLYATSPSAVEGIWSAIINGTYSGPIGDVWSATLANGGGDSAALSGNKWGDNQWLADVSGKVGGNDIDGQAAGTYADGTFDGLGAGRWSDD